MILYDYWRSSAAYRVRIALGLKGLAYDQVPIDLRQGDQSGPEFLAHNPQGLVPVLATAEGDLTQSLAIIEWLDETQPGPALLPDTPLRRAQARAMAQVIACDIHPLHNLRVLTMLRGTWDEEAVTAWIRHWIATGFTALEALIVRHGGRHACGDAPGLVDCCLIPQVYAANRFGLPLDAYPHLAAAAEAAAALPAVAAAHPSRQPGA